MPEAKMPSQLLRRLRYLLNRRRFDRELADEMEFHREMAARDSGARFGNELRLREEARDAWGWTWIDRLLQDLRYASRVLGKSPGFTLAAVSMLAIGIGINVAVFGFFNLMLLKPLPIRDPQTMLRFQRRAPGNFADNFPYPEVAFFRAHSKTLSAVLASTHSKLSIDGEEKQLDAQFVTANFFRELGGNARLGRMLDPSRDETPSAQPVVVLGAGFWRRHFGGDPSIIGKTIRLSDKPATVVGIASDRFSGLGLDNPDLWAPITQLPYFSNGSLSLTEFAETGINVFMSGRLQPGLSSKAAGQELVSLAAQLHKQHPKDIWKGESIPSEPGGFALTLRGEMYPVLGLAGALGLLILVVACVTLGGLLLARGVAREREIAIRVAVGAGRIRLMRQLFTESLMLATLGSAAGLALGYFALRSLVAITEAPPWLKPTLDWRIVAFAGAAGFTASILFGLTPAFQAARQRHRATIMRQILIGAQIAASCVLLIVSSLLVRALDRAMYAHPGFEYRNVISIDPALRGYSPARARAYFDRLQNRLRDLPGVESVSLVSNPPLGHRWTVVKTEVAGHRVDIHFNNIGPRFFETLKIPLLRGRSPMPGEAHAIVVSESLDRLQWPGEDPVGKLFRTQMNSDMAAVSDTVVGVSGNARLVSPEDSDAVEIYRLADPDFWPSMVTLVRTAGGPEGLIPSVTSLAKGLDRSLFPEVQLMKSAFRQKVQQAQNAAIAVSVLGFTALLLACLGLVGLVSYAVSQRTREIGIRMTLGARPSHVLTVVLHRLSLPVAVGLLAGIGGAAALSNILRGELYGIGNLDPVSYLAAIGVFAVTLTAAASVPARRALRVDPILALRQD